MKRFNNDENEEFGFFEDMDGTQYISEEEYEELLGKASEIQEMQLQIAQVELNQRLLAEAIDAVSKSWFWRFKSTKSKMKEIAATYKFFYRLTDPKGH